MPTDESATTTERPLPDDPEPPFLFDEEKTCPFPDCTFTSDNEFRHNVHYEQEHAGRVRVTVAVEVEKLLGGRDPQDVADTIYDKYAEDHEVAWTRAEVVDEASDHSELEGFDGD